MTKTTIQDIGSRYINIKQYILQYYYNTQLNFRDRSNTVELKKNKLKLIRQIFNLQGNLLTQNKGTLRCNNMVVQFVVKCILLVVVLIVGSVQTCYTYLNSWFIVVCSVHQHHAHHLFKKISIVNKGRWVVKVLTWGTKLARFCQNNECATMIY